jgi:hypothetical protein
MRLSVREGVFKAAQLCLLGGIVCLCLVWAGNVHALVPMFALGLVAHALRWLSGVALP